MAAGAEELRKVIARGKRRDRVFAYLGGLLIFLSLGTLGVLIADLVNDGAPHLLHTHEIKEGGNAPRFNDLIGQVKAKPASGDQPAVLEFTPDKMDVDISALTEKMDLKPEALAELLAAADGKRVVLTGSVPEPGGGGMFAAEKVATLAPDDEAGKPGARLGRGDLVGTLHRETNRKGQTAGYEFTPEPLVLDVADLEAPLPQPVDGVRVAVSPKRVLRREVGKLAVIEVGKLVPKNFLFSMPASSWYRAGILSAWVGTLLVMVVTIVTALPLGVAAGIYLEEYGRRSWVTAVVEVNIANLAAVPSIIWGLMGLGLFVYLMDLGHSILTAGLTLGLLVLPIIIIATREAIRAVPGTIRDASFALGATKWQTVRYHVLPYSMGGILTGSIVALSRAIGETAPLIVVGAVVYLTFLPPLPIEKRAPDAASGETAAQTDDASMPATLPATSPAEEEWYFQPIAWLKSPFTVLPIQMFNWTSRPEKEFHRNAAAAGLVLIVMTLGLNSLAIYLRARLRKRIKW